MLLLLASPGVARAGVPDCTNLLALRIALEGQSPPLADCDATAITAPAADYADCAGKTANACAHDRWMFPNVHVPLSGGSGTFVGSYLARCRDGTDSCAEADRVRCVDGSRPAVWVDNVPNPVGTLLFLQGGVVCREEYQNGFYRTAAQGCYDQYFGANGERLDREGMTSVGDNALMTRFGVLDPAGRFGRYRRVVVDRCTFDAYLGDQTVSGLTNAEGDGYDVYFHGRRGLEAMFATLGIAAGDAVVLVGASSAGSSAVHDADWVADRTGADVRAIVDDHFRPSAEMESSCPSELDCRGATPYGGSFFGTSPWAAIGDYDDTSYQPGGRREAWFSTWSDAPFDESCVAMHPSDAWKCWSTEHVVLHHLTTPTFLYESTRDPVQSASAGPAGVVDFDQEDGPTFVNWDAAHFQVRVRRQVDRLAVEGVDGGLREEAFDTTHTVEPFGYFFVNVVRHTVLSDVSAWHTVACLEHVGGAQVDVMDAAFRWVNGYPQRLMDGVGGWAAASTCAP